MFGSINKTFGCCGKFLVAATKILFVVPNFVAVKKNIFFRVSFRLTVIKSLLSLISQRQAAAEEEATSDLVTSRLG